MTYMICYWDSEAGEQKEREATPEEAAEIALRDGTVYVPQVVSKKQARLALNQVGKLSAVDTVIGAMPDDQKAFATIQWQDSATYERNNPTLNALATALGMTSTEIDNLFILAATL